MNRVFNLLLAAGFGAGMAYFFDPVAGRRRRALVRDQLIHAAKKSGRDVEAGIRDVRNRAYGTYRELSKDAQQVAAAAKESVRPLQRTVQHAGDENL